MRLAALGDIHGNADALRAVIADLQGQSPDLVVNLGDCLSGPLDWDRAFDLMAGQDWVTVRGNHDRWLTAPPDPVGPWEEAIIPRLTQAHRDWLAALPPTRTVDGIFLTHATPGDDLTYWLHSVHKGGTVAPRPLAEVEALAGNRPETLILCGHTHLAHATRRPGGGLIVNPGSVGCPGFDDDDPVPHIVAAGTPHARYAILDKTPQGWTVTHRLVPYDPTPAAALARASGNAAWAQALMTGFP